MFSQLRKYRFLLALLVPTMPVIGYVYDMNYYTLIVGLLGGTVLDFMFGRDRQNPPLETLPEMEKEGLYRAILYAYVPIHFTLIGWGAMVVASGSLSPMQLLGFMLSIGYVTGAQGITIAHELGHKRSKLDQFLSRMLLTSVCYGHFFIEHNRGHHVQVSTLEDPSSARFGESFYFFYPRSVLGSYISAWRLEAIRLQQRQISFLNWHNQMFWFTALPMITFGLFWWIWGPLTALFFLVQAWIAFTILELTNYIEHYGLVRRRLDNGRYERVSHLHSWNASERSSNCFLFNLQRHSDHHEYASRRYQALQHYEDSPQLPTGYAGMLLLATLPPLWFAVMNPRVRAYYSNRETAL